MRIAEFSVKNYQFTIIIFVMVIAIGVNALINMPKSEDPTFRPPFFIVVAVYPGTSPADMEELVVDPIEDKINELDDLDRMRSDMEDGLATIRVEFKYGTDRDKKYDDVVREINNLRPNLPQDIALLEVRKFSPSDVKIVQVALMSETAPYSDLERHAKKLEDKLKKVKSLKNIESEAYPERQVRVSLNFDKMAQYKIPSGRVMQAIQSENANIPGGSIEVGNKKFNIKTSGAYENIEEIRNTIVSSSGMATVRVRDIADVNLHYEDETYFARLNGKRAIFVTCSMKEGENILKVEDKVNAVLDEYQKELPKSIQFEKSFDQAQGVSKRLMGFLRDFTIAVVLVIFTLIPLGFRASLVVMISIPLSLAVGLALLNLAGYSINQLSVVGMVIALGLLVDDSIVVTENIARFLRNGYSRQMAAIEATKQIGLAVVGCTAVLIFAFLPLMFLPEASGEFIRSMPMAVTTTVLASLFVSITIVPFLASLLLKREEHEGGNWFLRGLKWMISGSYRRLLHKAIAHPVWTLLIAFGIFALSIGLIPLVGVSVFPKSDKPQFLVGVEAPLGTSLYETDKIAREVEKVLAKKKDIVSYATNIGKGNPRIYYNVVQKNEATNYAEFFVQLKPMELPEIEEFVDELREDFKDYPKARVQVKQFEQGPPLEAPIAVRVIGDNLDSLRKLAFAVEDIVKNTPGTIYVENPLTTQNTDLKIIINKEKAGLLGIPIVEIDRTIRMGIAGLNVGKFKTEDNEEININVSMPRGNRQTLEAFDKMFVSTNSGTLVPITQLAEIKAQESPTTIRHIEQDRYVTISAYIKHGFLTNDVTNEVIAKLEKFKFPKDYTYKMAGEVENRERSFGGLETIILITIFGILAILILEFKTFKSTLIVLSVIPLGVIGAVFILLITGNTFSFTAIVGIIALMGIEIKNSILLVDYTNQLRENGMGVDEAIEEAGETRFIPIILTSMTAIGGLIPLVIENSPLYSPLALVIIGGLISSTLLTRIVTPVLYKLLPPRVERRVEV
jgi:multidrug efflux pump subunit AcrB